DIAYRRNPARNRRHRLRPRLDGRRRFQRGRGGGTRGAFRDRRGAGPGRRAPARPWP
ncbi:MAG: hypothetical protein AVDCRST_MAG88-3717, partial [uncultured Thermomicrobiales bacterium]